jgi:hypothetical protein
VCQLTNSPNWQIGNNISEFEPMFALLKINLFPDTGLGLSLHPPYPRDALDLLRMFMPTRVELPGSASTCLFSFVLLHQILLLRQELVCFPPTIPVYLDKCTLGATATALRTATDAVGSEIRLIWLQIRDPQHYRPFESLALSLAIYTTLH